MNGIFLSINSRWPPKNELDALQVKKNIKIALSSTISEKIAFFCAYTETQDGHKKIAEK